MNKNKMLASLMALAVVMPALVSCKKPVDPVEEKKTYTLHDCSSGSPETWNPHTWETSTDSIIIDYTTIGLYDYVYKKDANGVEGYEIVPEMAEKLAVSTEVTDEEAALYGYTKDAETGKYPDGVKWVIDLNKNAKWQDGTQIDADDYVYSMKRLLDPEMQNRRADSYFAGSLILCNAKGYFRSGTSGIGSADDYKSDDNYNADMEKELTFFWDDSDASSTGLQKNLLGDYGSYYKSGAYGSTLLEFCNAAFGGGFTFTEDQVKALVGMTIADIKADAAKKAILDSLLTWWGEGDAGAIDFCTCEFSNPVVDWNTVGIKKTGDYQITLFAQNKLTEFYFYYSIGNWLVNEKVYEATRKQPSGATLYATEYGTSVEQYSSYGPYKLDTYQLDKQFTLSRNENWYGWTDGKHEGQFQTTNIVYDIVGEQEAQLLLFEQGKLDSVSLQGSNQEKYGKSSSLMYTPQSYTSKVTLNSSFNLLKQNQENKEEGAGGKSYNKTVLSNIHFREAMSWSLNRLDFVQSMTMGSGVGLILINDSYVIDPDKGTTFRGTLEGQQVIKNVYGDSETGYDKAKAIQLFNLAYDEELASSRPGSLEKGDIVSLLWEVYNDGWMDYINYYCDNIKAALQESKFGTNTDGITFEIETSVTGEAYSDHISEGSCEMGMSTWGGNALDPLGILSVYDSEDPNRYEPGFDANALDVTVNFKDGRTETHTFHEWVVLSDEEYSASNASVEDRTAITAAMEEAYLKTWNVISIYTRQSASLLSFKVNYITENYNMFYGYGGIRFMTYNYTDAEWDKLCSTTTLDYTR